MHNIAVSSFSFTCADTWTDMPVTFKTEGDRRTGASLACDCDDCDLEGRSQKMERNEPLCVLPVTGLCGGERASASSESYEPAEDSPTIAKAGKLPEKIVFGIGGGTSGVPGKFILRGRKIRTLAMFQPSLPEAVLPLNCTRVLSGETWPKKTWTC